MTEVESLLTEDGDNKNNSLVDFTSLHVVVLDCGEEEVVDTGNLLGDMIVEAGDCTQNELLVDIVDV